MAFQKPKVVVSKCLGFFACRYNSQMLNDDFVNALGKHVDYIPVCPEVEIGLGIPRFPVRVVRHKGGIRLVQPATGKDVTDEMRSFSGKWLSSAEAVDGFIMKNRSPSCGINDVRIYNKAVEGGVSGKGPGFFGGAALSSFRHLAIEDEGRLRNPVIREHFLCKLFALASLRPVRSMAELVAFHTDNKFLIMPYGQKSLVSLGRIVANASRAPPAEVIAAYRLAFGKALSAPPRVPATLNTLMHLFGYLSKSLSGSEKQFFFETLGLYREGRIPLSSALNVLRAWAIRQNQAYLMRQSLFMPYPRELLAANMPRVGLEL